MALRTCTIRLELVGRRATSRLPQATAISPPSICCDNTRWQSRQPVRSRWLSSDDRNDDGTPRVLYEGPFGNLSLKLKRVSVTTAAISLVGMPLLMYFHGGDVPASGQLAVGGTAIFAAAGSTIALSYCFSPYVHTLERAIEEDKGEDTADGEETDSAAAATSSRRNLVKATTANILSMKVETVFDPATDVAKPGGHRPFCNFVAAGVPMYVHPDLVYDEDLRLQLVGEAEAEAFEEAKKAAKKQDDDDTIL